MLRKNFKEGFSFVRLGSHADSWASHSMGTAAPTGAEWGMEAFHKAAFIPGR